MTSTDLTSASILGGIVISLVIYVRSLLVAGLAKSEGLVSKLTDQLASANSELLEQRVANAVLTGSNAYLTTTLDQVRSDSAAKDAELARLRKEGRRP